MHTDEKEMRFSSSHVTVVVSNYNGVAVVKDCFESIQGLTSPPGEILMIDDGSEDGSPALVRELFPHVRVVELGFNSGNLNKLRNRALEESKTDFVFLVDNDVTLKPDCLDQLLGGLKNLPQAAVCIPRTLYERDPSMIYQDGQVLHYVGTSLARNRDFPLKDADDRPRLTIGWGVQLVDKRQAAELGNFSEDYVMGWGDDGEFNHKMNLAGHFCYHIPSAVVYHKRVKGARRYYGTVRNRWRFLLELYQAKTLILCTPALVVYEMSVILFILKKREMRQYLTAMKYVLANIGSILSVRRHIQPKRLVNDRELMTSGSIFISSEYVDSAMLAFGYKVMNSFLNGYWLIIRGVL
ncbi:MAG TPA: glycosyltransferase [Vicinamibacterales bacterium]|nr:glycosyltransferase [Vicinamibacterales bacterium]